MLDVTRALQSGENLLALRVLKPGSKERIDGFILDEIPHRMRPTWSTAGRRRVIVCLSA